MLDTTDTLMHITDIGEGKGGQLKPNQQQQLTQRLIPTICIEDTMDMDIPTDTTDKDMDTMDILMLDTTLENKQPKQKNIKETPKYIVKSHHEMLKTNLQRRPSQPHWTCLCPSVCLSTNLATYRALSGCTLIPPS